MSKTYKETPKADSSRASDCALKQLTLETNGRNRAHAEPVESILRSCSPAGWGANLVANVLQKIVAGDLMAQSLC